MLSKTIKELRKRNSKRKGQTIMDNNLTKTPASYNEYYKTYKAAHCKLTGLPLYNHNTAEQMITDNLYSQTRAKKERVIIDETAVCGWYRVYNGYIPLFKTKRQSNG